MGVDSIKNSGSGRGHRGDCTLTLGPGFPVMPRGPLSPRGPWTNGREDRWAPTPRAQCLHPRSHQAGAPPPAPSLEAALRPGLPSGLAAPVVPASQGCPAIREGCWSVTWHAGHCLGDAETAGSQARKAHPLILALKADVSGWQAALLGQCTQLHTSA